MLELLTFEGWRLFFLKSGGKELYLSSDNAFQIKMNQEQATYRIMGIDPGTNYMGYGIIEVEGSKLRSGVMGDIDLHTMSDPYRKLRYIFDRVSRLIEDYQPKEVALE